jgi:catechol 2,3-dioxygenase-like lactoylglutathione lyase family enzyme
MKILSIKETCIYVNNLERKRDFYSGKLRLPLISAVKGHHAFFRAGESVLLCFNAEQTQKEAELPPHDAYGNTHFAFEISKTDYPDTLLHIKNCGIEIFISMCGRMAFALLLSRS